MRFLSYSFVILLCLSLVFAETNQNAASAPEQGTQEASPVVTLTDDNFNNYVVPKENSSWLIMFYAPWCGHCKHAKPGFEDFSRAAYGKVNVGLVDCDANPTLRSRFSVGGYPTFLYFNDGSMYQYRGPRNVDGWTNFVTEGYKGTEGEEIPLEASMVKNFTKEFKRFLEQLKYIAVQKPLVFGGVIGGFILIIALTCFCGSAIEERIEGNKGQTAEGTTRTPLIEKKEN